jgi:predicted P-loop ATPase/GTPase
LLPELKELRECLKEPNKTANDVVCKVIKYTAGVVVQSYNNGFSFCISGHGSDRAIQHTR